MRFEVDTGRVAQELSSMESTLKQISDNRKTMYQSLETLDGMWRGEAHDAFHAQFTEDDEEMQRLIQDIKALFTDIGKARQSYETCESEIRQMAANLHI